MRDYVGQFCDAIRSAGLEPPETIEPEGKLRRFSSSGKRGDDSGWYVLHGDGIPAGSFGDWRTGLSQAWRADIGRTLNPAEEAAHRSRVETMRREREAEEAKRKAEARERAALLWAEALPCASHPYLNSKGIAAHGARLHRESLVLPMRDAAGVLHSLQFIDTNGSKRFLSGGRVTGCYFSIGSTKDAAALAICEGFATGATIHEATGYPVAVAFNAGNLAPVAKALREKFPKLPLILCADDDNRTEGNPGKTKAAEAAMSIKGIIAVPDFGNERPDSATDFNDLAHLRGAEAVKQALANASAPTRGERQPDTENATSGHRDGWSVPQPLAVKVEPEPYPLDALPDTIRAAVEELQGFTKAPVPLVASSALAALSLAIQAHADAKRAEKLTGPVSLFLLTIADSGERKSTCDGFFTKAIHDYEKAQAETAKPKLKDHRAAMQSWEAKLGGIKDKIRLLSKQGNATSVKEAELRDLGDAPEPPRVPKLIYGDATPEALKWNLAKLWPSGGVVSAEGGIVFGSHGMNKESIMRNLATLNELWDGKPISTERRTSESFTVRGARLTIGIQVQEATLRSFFDRSGALARGTGFLARFLVAWPESTQGFRPFTDPPESWPALAAFNKRISAILDQPTPIDEDGALSPFMLLLTVEAKAAWVAFHDAIESELASGGELYDVRDVASKSADNAARLAALFQVFEGAGGAIGADAFESASRIAAWHLNEARRFFGELALPAELADAARLDSWLLDYCRRERTHIVPRREVQRNVTPVHLRQKATLEDALKELTEAGRVLLVQEGRRKEIHVNPALIEGGAV